MFETLFTYPGTIRRHQEGPLAFERAAYLREQAAQGMAKGTLLRRSSYCLCVAVELQRWSPGRCFNVDEIGDLANTWATKQFKRGRASSPHWPRESFRFVATDFLRKIGRLSSDPPPKISRHESKITEFIASQKARCWQSDETCRSARWQIARFLTYLDYRCVDLGDVAPIDIDAFFNHMAQQWSRSSIRTSGKILRRWFKYCETRGWVQSGLSKSILLPRIYRHEGLPIGPSWNSVGRILAETNGNDPASIRDHAIILLLSVYGIRSGEVRRLRLEDIDWLHDRIRYVRSKSRRQESSPLEPTVGKAIARYLRYVRPKTDSRVVFLTLRAPHRPLSAGGLYGIVERHISKNELSKGRGPHGLRHACARHLLESGQSFKEVGDHLGHRSPEATNLYAKVDLVSLRKVAFEDIGGLA